MENIMQKSAPSISRDNHYAWTLSKDTTEPALLTQNSTLLGGIIGEIFGALIGTITGSLTIELTGILMGFTAGVIFGAITGMLVGALVSKTAGVSGGPSIGAYSGMVAGAIMGTIIGITTPESLRASTMLLHTPVLETLASSRFETIAFFAFLFCILGMVVGVWVGGINHKTGKEFAKRVGKKNAR